MAEKGPLTLIVGASTLGAPYRASERIRCDWIAPHIPATIHKPDTHILGYDVTIWVKVSPTHRIAPTQIVDLCDPACKFYPDNFHNALQNMDAITVPTEAAREECQKFLGDYPPVFIVRDGHKLDWYPTPEKTGPRYVWFGYCRNFLFASPFVQKLNPADVSVVTDEDVGFGHFTPHKDDYQAYNTIGSSKIALHPTDESRLKSNNREVTAWRLGLAVAKNMDDIERFQDPDEIRKDVEEHQELVNEHSVEKAGEDMRKAIEAVHNDSTVQGPPASLSGAGRENPSIGPVGTGTAG